MKYIIITLFITLFAMIEVTAKTTAQSGYRWRNNDGDEKTASWKTEEENVPIYFEGTDVVRLRLQEFYGDSENPEFEEDISLFYSLVMDPLTWVKITDDDTSNAFVLHDSGNAFDVPTTPQLTEVNYEWTPGVYFSTSKYDQSHTIFDDQYTEYEWAFRPTDNAVPGVYYFVKGWNNNINTKALKDNGKYSFSIPFQQATMYYEVPMPAIPLSNWAIYSSLILIVGFMGYRFWR